MLRKVRRMTVLASLLAPEIACASRHYVGIRRALLPRGSSSDSVLVAHTVHVLPKERHR